MYRNKVAVVCWRFALSEIYYNDYLITNKQILIAGYFKKYIILCLLLVLIVKMFTIVNSVLINKNKNEKGASFLATKMWHICKISWFLGEQKNKRNR